MEDPDAPGPLAPISGLGGLSTTSRVVYDEAPDRPHLLTLSFAFPARVRWWLELEGDPEHARLAEYRYGAHFYLVAPGSAASRELAGDERLRALRRTELRRALLLWPEGFAWSGSGARRTAPLAPDRDGLPPGELRAELDDAGRPLRLAVIDRSGSEQEALRVEGWSERGGRQWPDPVELHVSGARVWSETLRTAKPSAGTGSGLYLPGDRLVGQLDPTGSSTAVEPTAVPAEWRLAIALEPGVDAKRAWAALAQAAGRHGARASRLELDREGRVTRGVLSRSEVPDPGDPRRAEWTHAAETPALTRFLPATSPLDRAALSPLYDRVPPGYRAGPPTARQTGPSSRPRLQLVLPLEPEQP